MNKSMTENTDSKPNQRNPGSASSRRSFLSAAAGSMLLPLLRFQPAAAQPATPQTATLQTLIDKVTGGVPVQDGHMTLELPQVADNGNSVALKVVVDSPMSEHDYVQSIHLFAPKNPRPVMARYYLNPRSGRAEINTRIRLAATQEVTAVAAMNDGSFRKTGARVIVAMAACLDGS
jgi:sulfur-oxidizing protein SoxY